jgi:hypothetical protein
VTEPSRDQLLLIIVRQVNRKSSAALPAAQQQHKAWMYSEIQDMDISPPQDPGPPEIVVKDIPAVASSMRVIPLERVTL